MDPGEEGETSACNGEKLSAFRGSEMEGSDKEEAEEEGEDGETNALLTTEAVNGCLTGKKWPTRRKVQWNDYNGGKLAEALEFDPSDPSDSEDDMNHKITIWEQVITGCMHFFCCSSN